MIEVASFHTNLFSQFMGLFDNPFFVAFTIVVVIDLVLDLIKPYYFKDAHGFNAIIRNGVTYLAWTLIYPYLRVTGLGDMADVFLLAFIYQYALFIIEAYTSFGWWLPEGLRTFIEARLKRTNDKIKKGGK